MKAFLKGFSIALMVVGVLFVLGSVGSSTASVATVAMNALLGFIISALGHWLFTATGGKAIFVRYNGFRRY